MASAMLGERYIHGLCDGRRRCRDLVSGQPSLFVCPRRAPLSSLDYVSKWHLLPSRLGDIILELWSFVGAVGFAFQIESLHLQQTP